MSTIEPAESRSMSGFGPTRPIDERIARIAETQHGVISGEQLMQLGLNQDAIDYRVAVGRLHRLHQGVFAVGHAHVTEEGEFLAGVLAVGNCAILGSISSLALWGIRERHASEPVHVTVARDVRHPGLVVRTVTELPLAHASRRRGIRVLMPAPALLEAATLLDDRELRRAVGQALVAKRVSAPVLVELLARSRGRRGARRLARVLAHAKPTRSELEDATVAFLSAHAFPPFETNARVHGEEVDVLWRRLRLVIEADGGMFHDNPVARADDAAKQARLEARGLRVERLRWRDVTSSHNSTAAALRLTIAETGESRK